VFLHPTRDHIVNTVRQILIKDIKSANGTFINGERLSLEGRESTPYELKNDDILVSHPRAVPPPSQPSDL
jgi:pSer/pThr/pTyr-binding forkhead associated (FHA) protein